MVADTLAPSCESSKLAKEEFAAVEGVLCESSRGAWLLMSSVTGCTGGEVREGEYVGKVVA